MSDPKSSVGEPVDEPGTEDVVSRAQEGLADAEAALKNVDADGTETAAGAEAPDRDGPGDSVEDASTTPESRPTSAFDGPEITDPAEFAAAMSGGDEPEVADATAPASSVDDAPTALLPPAAQHDTEVTPPAAEQVVLGAAGGPIFIQAPEAPRPRGNRGAAGAIGLLAALVFAALSVGVKLALGLAGSELTLAEAGAAALQELTTWTLWVPVVVYFLAFWLFGAMINRGRWGVWVHLGLLIGVIVYGGYLLGLLFQAPFWEVTASQGAQLLQDNALAPMAVASFVIGREVTIWFGAWVAARGRRLNELNREAQREYERTLEAGPQLQR